MPRPGSRSLPNAHHLPSLQDAPRWWEFPGMRSWAEPCSPCMAKNADAGRSKARTPLTYFGKPSTWLKTKHATTQDVCGRTLKLGTFRRPDLLGDWVVLDLSGSRWKTRLKKWLQRIQKREALLLSPCINRASSPRSRSSHKALSTAHGCDHRLVGEIDAEVGYEVPFVRIFD